MPYINDTYANIKNRLLDWLQVDDTGGNVSSVSLDLINRAQAWLWGYRAWAYFITTSSLTLTNKAVALPADFGRIVRVWHDSDSDGKPDFFYHHKGDVARGYELRDAFLKASGHAWTITFYSNPTYTPKLEYMKLLPDFAGSGTEYSYFPGELILRTAQMLHYGDAEMVGNEYSIVKDLQAQALRDYEQSHQYVNEDSIMPINDDQGQRVEIDSFAMDGSTDGYTNNYDPSYDRG